MAISRPVTDIISLSVHEACRGLQRRQEAQLPHDGIHPKNLRDLIRSRHRQVRSVALLGARHWQARSGFSDREGARIYVIENDYVVPSSGARELWLVQRDAVDAAASRDGGCDNGCVFCGFLTLREWDHGRDRYLARNFERCFYIWHPGWIDMLVNPS